jgi:sugar lactone lactonase YvrE
MGTVIVRKKSMLLKGRGLDGVRGSQFLGIMIVLCLTSMTLLIPRVLLAAPGDISTVAGNGGVATSSSLNSPHGVAVDSYGNIYIADFYNNRIRKVDTSGVITTVAGNGTPGYSGDYGPATSASLNYPTGVAVDTAGNVYIADTYNRRIRKVNTSGVITTVAGDGTCD